MPLLSLLAVACAGTTQPHGVTACDPEGNAARDGRPNRCEAFAAMNGVASDVLGCFRGAGTAGPEISARVAWLERIRCFAAE